MIGIIVSFLLGLVSSYAVWWLVNHYWVPNVIFSEELVEYELPSGESLFQCALQNSGRRDIIDLEIQVRVGIFGFLGAQTWAYHTVRSNASRVPLLSKEKRRRIRLHDTREAIEFVDKPSKTLRKEIECCRSLREVLGLGDDATVRVHVLGFDSFSGSRKHFQSKPYRKTDIRKGTFNGLDAVENARFK